MALKGSSVRRQIDAAQNGDASDGLNFEQIAFPRDKKMPAICALIDEETVRIEVLSREAESAVSLRQERQSALISAAVTSKIDVRALAPASAKAA
jgi:type I restriction enzyme, S subunit